jgi:ATP diphosphatase
MAELQRAVKLQKRAARAGFDWASPGPVLDKLREETLELREAMESGDVDHIEDELGDLLFVVTNLARQLDVDPARALRRGNAKFERRFRRMEQVVRDDPGMKSLDTMSLNEMETMWKKVKQEETARPQSESSG